MSTDASCKPGEGGGVRATAGELATGLSREAVATRPLRGETMGQAGEMLDCGGLPACLRALAVNLPISSLFRKFGRRGPGLAAWDSVKSPKPGLRGPRRGHNHTRVRYPSAAHPWQVAGDLIVVVKRVVGKSTCLGSAQRASRSKINGVQPTMQTPCSLEMCFVKPRRCIQRRDVFCKTAKMHSAQHLSAGSRCYRARAGVSRTA